MSNNKKVIHWVHGNLYILLIEQPDYIGLSASLVYRASSRTLQFLLQIGTFSLVFGYEFRS